MIIIIIIIIISIVFVTSRQVNNHNQHCFLLVIIIIISSKTTASFLTISRASLAVVVMWALCYLFAVLPSSGCASPGDIDHLCQLIRDTVPDRVLRCNGWSAQGLRGAVEETADLHCVEFFCGTAGLTAALLSQGLRVAWYDMLLEPIGMNLLTVAGFAAALRLVLRVVPGGFVWWGTPCQTFIWLARGHTKRTWKNPEGDVTRRDVRGANEIVRRQVLLTRILVARGCFFLVEQPMSSCMWRLKTFKHFWKERPTVAGVRMIRKFVWLGFFGHSLPKGTVLVGIFPQLDRLKSKRPAQQFKMETDMWKKTTFRIVAGRRVWRVHGTKKLKESEHYPPRFCATMAAAVYALIRSTERRQLH